jgi:hypothetical protein
MTGHSLRLLEGLYGVSRIEPGAPIPPWAEGEGLASITRSTDELSIVCLESRVPEGVGCERGWRCLQVVGPFSFETVGVLAALAASLAEAGVPILCISTYDTDYLLLREADVPRARQALLNAGHAVIGDG